MTHRIERLNQLIRQEISELLHRQVKDPRLGGFVAVTEISTSLDLKYAKIFVCRIDGAEEKQETLSALTGASGFLRKELAKRLKVRRIPELRFEWDDSIERGSHLLNLIDKTRLDREH
ncbi:MAG: ribosome-binding factor A [Dehalococcoidales bacterium]|jgi:ribosome-binding factor A|nr:ribosome-binding factor A [Dehalococcoidales bacterium]|tara:strand:- start:110 stop:463 length:354 start_codon:yes stop_codon:yes gene_type:complete